MAKFHRLTSISDAYDYVVGGSAGVFPADYDYINNNPANTQAGALGPRTTSPYNNGNGTYFVGIQDDATDPIANRPHKALAENDDYLDNLMRRAIGVPGRLVIPASATAYDTITIPATEHMWGGDGTTHRYDLIKITDEVGDCIYDLDQMQEVRADVVSPTPGDASYVLGKGFATTDVVVTSDIPIPAGVKVHVHYLKRGCLADLTRDAMLPMVRASMARNGNVSSDIARNTNDIATMTERGLDAIYYYGYNKYRSLVDNLPERPGNAIIRSGAAPTVYSIKSGGHDYSYDAFDACWKAVVDDAMGLSGQSNRVGGSSCYVGYGPFHRGNSAETKAPTVAGLWTLNAHMLNNHPDKASFDTNITWDGACSVTYDGVSSRVQVTLLGTDDRFWAADLGGIKNSSITTGIDVLLVYNPNATTGQAARVAYVVDALDPANNKRAFLRKIDGSNTTGITNFNGTVRWLSTSVVNSLGTAEYWNKMDANKRLGFTGFQYLAAPLLDNAAVKPMGYSYPYPKGTPATFYASSDADTSYHALEWGYRSYSVDAYGKTKVYSKGALVGDGTLKVDKITSYGIGAIEFLEGTRVTHKPLVEPDGMVNTDSGLLTAPFIEAHWYDSSTDKLVGKVSTPDLFVTTLGYLHSALGETDPGLNARIVSNNHFQLAQNRRLCTDQIRDRNDTPNSGLYIASNGIITQTATITNATIAGKLNRPYVKATLTAGGSAVTPALTINASTQPCTHILWNASPVNDTTFVYYKLTNVAVGDNYRIVFDIGGDGCWGKFVLCCVNDSGTTLYTYDSISFVAHAGVDTKSTIIDLTVVEGRSAGTTRIVSSHGGQAIPAGIV